MKSETLNKADASWRRVAPMLGLCLLLYLFSLGPATVLFFWSSASYGIGTAYEITYKPLLVAAEATGSQRIVAEYVDIWLRVFGMDPPAFR